MKTDQSISGHSHCSCACVVVGNGFQFCLVAFKRLGRFILKTKNRKIFTRCSSGGVVWGCKRRLFLFFSFFFQKEVFSACSCFVKGVQGQIDEEGVLKGFAERSTVKRTEEGRWSCFWSLFTGVD